MDAKRWATWHEGRGASARRNKCKREGTAAVVERGYDQNDFAG